MNCLTCFKKKVPYPVKLVYRSAWGLLRDVRNLNYWGYWAEVLAVRFLSPQVQRLIPGLFARLKILPSSKISLITTCGNRLEYIKDSLPTYLGQSRSNYDVIISIYADQQGCAEYIREHFGCYLDSGRLKLIETQAVTFTKARAVNIAAKFSNADYLLLVDSDCWLNGNYALERITRYFNIHPYQLASFSFWGQILVRRDRFIEVGGYDVTLNDGWAPDDFDFIARYIVYFHEPYIFLSPTYTFLISPQSISYRITRNMCKRETLIIHKREERDSSFDLTKFKETKFYRRIGGLKESKEEYFDATLSYFEQHNPQVEFVAQLPV